MEGHSFNGKMISNKRVVSVQLFHLLKIINHLSNKGFLCVSILMWYGSPGSSRPMRKRRVALTWTMYT